jgi:hypothetical protein
MWINKTTPEFVESVLEQNSYKDMFFVLEEGSHNAIPAFIAGDFDYETAPNGEFGERRV